MQCRPCCAEKRKSWGIKETVVSGMPQHVPTTYWKVQDSHNPERATQQVAGNCLPIGTNAAPKNVHVLLEQTHLTLT